MTVLREIAEEIGVHERTLRRGLSQRLIHGSRPSPRTVELGAGEIRYLRAQWPLLSALREALRTERSVRLAVLIGSAARSNLKERSDIDLVVGLGNGGWRARDELSARLESAVGRPVDLVEIEAAIADPQFLDAILREGRVLVDREDQWPRYLSERDRVARRAAAAERALRRDMHTLLAELSEQA